MTLTMDEALADAAKAAKSQEVLAEAAMQDRIVLALRAIAERNGGKAPTQAEFFAKAAFNKHTVYKVFGNYGNACEAAGLARPTRGGNRSKAKRKKTSTATPQAPKLSRVDRALALLHEERDELKRRLKVVESSILRLSGKA